LSGTRPRSPVGGVNGRRRFWTEPTEVEQFCSSESNDTSNFQYIVGRIACLGVQFSLREVVPLTVGDASFCQITLDTCLNSCILPHSPQTKAGGTHLVRPPPVSATVQRHQL